MLRLFFLVLLAPVAWGQWQIQDSHSTASLRGIHSLGGGVAWASGSGGTVLRTVDGGINWQKCAVPEGGDKLDFRGVQGFDGMTAIVMSSGKGDLSRLYKTVDGCVTWKLVFMNPDAEGFWDALIARGDEGFLLGDPVDGKFAIFSSSGSKLEVWKRFGASCYSCPVFNQFPFKTESMFAASNSILEGGSSTGIYFVSGGADGAFFRGTTWGYKKFGYPATDLWSTHLPLAVGASSGAFSLSSIHAEPLKHRQTVVVGGNYSEPASGDGTAAYSNDGGLKWKASTSSPHGYRSGVAYDADVKAFITVGPNGTDISTDDGRNWKPLKPGSGEAPDADQHWNALSLPFVVGSHGRIGVLRPDALTKP